MSDDTNVLRQTARAMVGMMRQQPRGQILELRYTRKALPPEHDAAAPQAVGNTAAAAAMGGDVLEIRIDTPDGENTLYFPNEDFAPNNPSLQLMAAIGVQPSDFDGQQLDLSDEGIAVPITYDDSESAYGITSSVLERGKRALAGADWAPWDADDLGIDTDEESTDDESDGTQDDSDEDDGGSDGGIDVAVR